MLKVCHLYPDLMNLYGDRGNIIAFVRRCQWRDIPVEVQEVNIGEKVDFQQFDFLFMGGGSDREQSLMETDLMTRRDTLKNAIEQGLVILAICGGYQMLGKYYKTHQGEMIPGLDILDLYTEAGPVRMIGNVAIETEINGRMVKLVGFENHSGQTFLGHTQPLGKILSGHGNNGKDRFEGARYKNVFCSYFHGPVLPKNTQLTDHLISLASQHRGMNQELTVLDDTFEQQAVEVMLRRLL